MLGEEQFRGVQIYDIIQDHKLNYLFATNEGVYYYDYYTYQKLECDKTKSSSVFNFVINAKGAVYCHNLNNQIFKIQNGECVLFYELKTDERSSDISLIISNKNELLIGAKKIIVLNDQGAVVQRYDFINHYLGPSFMAPNKTIHFHLGGCDTVLTYHAGVFTKNRIKTLSGLLNPNSALKMFTVNSKVYAFDQETGNIFGYKVSDLSVEVVPKNKALEGEGSKRIYETGKEIWVAGTLPGVAYYNESSGQNEFFYKNYFVSTVFKDQEGNILLGTFDKGVLVIPDLKIPDVIHSFRDDPVTAICPNSKYGLIIGTSTGKLMNYSNRELRAIEKSAKRSVEAIYGGPNSELIFFDNGGGTAYNLRNGELNKLVGASLKDAVMVSESKFYLGTNLGIYKVQRTASNKFNSALIKGMNYRVYSIEYERENGNLYASTANGLFKIDSLGEIKRIMFNNEDVFPNSLYEHEGKIYACTEKNGILVIQKEAVTSVVEPRVNNRAEPLRKILITHNNIIGSSTNGFFQFDMKGRLVRSISSAFGFGANKVTDFNIQDGGLWISHSGGVQQIDLSYVMPSGEKPLVRLDKVIVNDKPIDSYAEHAFKSNDRKIKLVFSSPTLKNKELIKFHYKLLGYDTAWIVNNYDLNQVTYNALDAGTYTFVIKAEDQGVYSNSIEYSFVIATPVYARWWFIITIGSLALVLIVAIYKQQLKLQQKKSQQINELNASKLAAIQSQMNPHFIFNSLNSIQDLVLKGDVENSYSYITTFSDLVRRTLSYSEKDFIEFEQEIKLLNLYLTLEKLRFKKNLAYRLDPGNVEDIMIPPMLIQPFIENSLAHGLLHKDGEKRLTVSFELKDVLICTIEDNGIGREQAKAIKQRQNTTHESFSGNAIGKRLDILSHVFEEEFGYTYEDLYDNQGSIGTRVILTIPIKRKF
jgi:hypothetical protein